MGSSAAMARRPLREQFWDVSGHRDQPAPRPRFRSSDAGFSCVWVRASPPQRGHQPAPLCSSDEPEHRREGVTAPRFTRRSPPGSTSTGRTMFSSHGAVEIRSAVRSRPRRARAGAARSPPPGVGRAPHERLAEPGQPPDELNVRSVCPYGRPLYITVDWGEHRAKRCTNEARPWTRGCRWLLEAPGLPAFPDASPRSDSSARCVPGLRNAPPTFVTVHGAALTPFA
jgi:hypothetical protein